MLWSSPFCSGLRCWLPISSKSGTVYRRTFGFRELTHLLSSDGYWEEWCDGRDLYAQLWPGETIKCPLRGYEEDEKEAETNSEDRKDAVCSK